MTASADRWFPIDVPILAHIVEHFDEEFPTPLVDEALAELAEVDTSTIRRSLHRLLAEPSP